MTVDTPAPTIPPPLTQPLRDLDAWVAHFRDAEIPVRANTADAPDVRLIFRVPMTFDLF